MSLQSTIALRLREFKVTANRLDQVLECVGGLRQALLFLDEFLQLESTLFEAWGNGEALQAFSEPIGGHCFCCVSGWTDSQALKGESSGRLISEEGHHDAGNATDQCAGCCACTVVVDGTLQLREEPLMGTVFEYEQ